MPACKSAGWGISITADKADDIISGPGEAVGTQQYPAAGLPDVAFPLSQGAFTWSQPSRARASHHIAG